MGQRDAARDQALEDRRLFVGDALDHAEGLQMRGRDGGDHRHIRARHARQRRDLAGGVHADLDDGESVSMGIRASVTGTPQWLLKLASAAWVRPCASSLAQHLLDRGLADRARDGDDLGPGPRARGAPRSASPSSTSGTIRSRAGSTPSGLRETSAAAAPFASASATKSCPSRAAESATNRSPGGHVRLSIEMPVAVQSTPPARPSRRRPRRRSRAVPAHARGHARPSSAATATEACSTSSKG
jgi:hypothetical protein